MSVYIFPNLPYFINIIKAYPSSWFSVVIILFELLFVVLLPVIAVFALRFKVYALVYICVFGSISSGYLCYKTFYIDSYLTERAAHLASKTLILPLHKKVKNGDCPTVEYNNKQLIIANVDIKTREVWLEIYAPNLCNVKTNKAIVVELSELYLLKQIGKEVMITGRPAQEVWPPKLL